jgi:hypothetical protein
MEEYMKFNTKVLYALMAAGLALPTASVQAWPWKWGGAAPLIKKVEEKAKEEVKKEAAKQSSLAWKATKVVGGVALDATVATAKGVGSFASQFAIHNPLLTAGLIAGGITYYKNKDEIDKKVSMGKAALMAYGAYTLYGQTKGLMNLFGSNPSAHNVAPAQPAAPTLPVVNQPVAAKKSADQIREDEAMNAMVDDYLQYVEQQEKAEVARKEAQEKATLETAWKQAEDQRLAQESERQAKEKSDVLKRAQERIERLKRSEVSQFDNAWKEVEQKSAIEKIDKQLKEDAAVLNCPAPENALPFIDQEYARRHAADFLNRPEDLLHPLVIPLVPELTEEQKHEWVKEFEEQEAREAAQHPKLTEWTKEYRNNNALERAMVIARQLVDSADINDEGADTAQVTSLEDNRARMIDRGMIDTLNRLQPGCAPTALRPL